MLMRMIGMSQKRRNSMDESDWVEIDLKAVLNRFMTQGLTLDQAIEKVMRFADLKADFKERILLEVWRNQDGEMVEDEDGTYFPNDRDTMISSISLDKEVTEKFLYNLFYKLRHDGLIETRIKLYKRRYYTLAKLSDRGLDALKGLREDIKKCYIATTQVS